MQLQYIYKEDINRNINGVIKADQNDNANLEQEFKEYIITTELRKHFSNFLDVYEKSIDTPTDNVGVWISGFFGSGKSHFLKIISYLLSNENISGKNAVDYFEDKFDDPLMFAQLKRCASVPTDSILFNIDVKSSIKKDKTAIVRVFAKVFYEHLGFYGNDLKVAKFEQFLYKQGKINEFKARFNELNGDSWENSREAFAFWGDDIVQALCDVTNISKETATNWFNGEENSEISIDELVSQIKEYVDRRGKDFRLVFCVDEIGQYIGTDSNMILNLQSIVEEIGAKCAGKVWVLVTAQEAIDTVIKVSSQDFSKIQARFKTRLSLTSSSVDEVIKKRILAKNDNAIELLKMKYDDNASVLKNLISFSDSRADLKGYSSPMEYIDTYPFIPYQFTLFQNTLTEIRKHGNAGQHQSSGERSMLSGFQEVAQQLNDRDENALVPYFLFYNTVNTFLESTIRQVIDRCQRAADSGDGIEPYDVDVLKLLYLVRYIDDIPTNIDNIATLMADDISIDKINLRKKVKESLDRLLSQNYISKNGNTYQFLTDDEQDVAREIKNTMVDSAQVISNIATNIFDDLYMSKNVRIGDNILPFDQYVDDTVHGSPSRNGDAIKLRIITAASDLIDANESTFIMKSQSGNEAICVLSTDYKYFDEIHEALKIRKYVKTRIVSQCPETIQQIIRGKQAQATGYEKEARELIEKAIVNGTFYISGQKIDVPGTNVKDKFNNALKELVDFVYSKLSLVRHNYQSDAEILEIFNNNQISLNTGNANSDAINEVSTWLNAQAARHLSTSMADVQKRYSGIPYGWREIDIASIIAELIVQKHVNISYGGAIVTERNGHLIDLLRKKSEVDKTIVEKREEIDQRTITNIKKFLHEYLDVMDVPSDEDELVEFIVERFSEKNRKLGNIIDRFYTQGKPYPGRNIVMNAQSTIENVLTYKKDSRALFKKIIEKQDDLLDDLDDTEDVFKFFETQKTTFEKGVDLVAKLKDEEVYFENIAEAKEAINSIKSIIELPKPYKRINEIPNLVQVVEDLYNSLLTIKKKDISEYLEDAAKQIMDVAKGSMENHAVKSANGSFVQIKRKIEDASSLVNLDAMKTYIDSVKNNAVKAIFDDDQKAIIEEQKRQADIVADNDDSFEVDVPQIKVSKVNKETLVPTVQLKSKEEIDEYVEMIKKSLYKKLDGNDYIQIF